MVTPAALQYSKAEVLNSLTHGIGFLLAMLGAGLLMFKVLAGGEMLRIVGCGIFAAALVGVYAASTLSHVVLHPERRRWFRILDHVLIYVLVVGTFTPFALVYLTSGGWWLYLAAMWAIAVLGITAQVCYGQRVANARYWSYIVLGWMPILPGVASIGSAPTEMLQLVLGGGLCYTFGTIFLVYDGVRFYFHAVWHLLVMAGSALHFIAVYYYVA
jgi:hemolysin III